MALQSYTIVDFIKKNELRMKIGQKEVLKYFWKKSMDEKKLFILTILGGVGAALVSLYLPVLYSQIIDVISESNNTNRLNIVPMLLHIVMLIGLIEVGSIISRGTFGLSIVPLEISGIKRIFSECFEYIHKHSYRFFTNNFGGSLVKKVNKLAYAYERITDIFMHTFLRIIIFLPLIVITMFLKNRILGIIFLGFIVLFGVIQHFMYKANVPFEIKSNEHDSKITGELSDTITNNLNILTFSSNIREFKLFFRTLSSWEIIKKKTRYRGTYIHLISDVILIIFEVLSIYFAIILWGAGEISTGTIVLVQAYIFKIVEQMFSLGHVFKRLNSTIGESAEMIEVLETPHEIQDIKGAKNMQIRSGKIEFKNVAFAYNKGQMIFDDLSFKIKPGEKVAFVGESGSGKTSIVKLLLRFFDLEDGKILIDEQDISKTTQNSLRNSISIVPQDPILFHRTLKENIAYGKPDASEEEILAASKMARCHRFIKTLPAGYDTLVGERGIKLSGGERQRVAIARAILENKGILILDEATSALDSESEMLIQEAMASLMRKKTTIIVAHRLSTIMNMDKIIVMDQGKIVEIGTHKELLLNKDGIYKNLWDIQSGGFGG